MSSNIIMFTWYVLQVDPFLKLVDDSKLQAVKNEFGKSGKVYASKEDDEAALKSLSSIKRGVDQSRESFASIVIKNLGTSSDVCDIVLLCTDHHMLYMIDITLTCLTSFLLSISLFVGLVRGFNCKRAVT